MIDQVPEGFEPHFRKSPFTDPWEPLYSRRGEKSVAIGLRLAKPHTNSRGLIHGGLIASLADNAMGYSCSQALGWTASLVTISLAVDFVGRARHIPSVLEKHVRRLLQVDAAGARHLFIPCTE